jgi:hypothetical protein
MKKSNKYRSMKKSILAIPTIQRKDFRMNSKHTTNSAIFKSGSSGVLLPSWLRSDLAVRRDLGLANAAGHRSRGAAYATCVAIEDAGSKQRRQQA